MNSSIKTIIMMLFLVVTLQSCNQDPSLQRYYVDSELAPGFTSLDIPTSMLKIDKTTLTEEELEAYESIEKLSLLAYVIEGDDKAEEFEVELAKVKTILNNPKYEELMRGGNTTDGKFVVKFLGEEDSIEEIILMGASNDRGFAVVRVLGDDMNVDKIMTLTSVFEKANINDSELKQFTNFFE
ncbi:DUF4252 domain-containing protein [uncultured Psychroserpens sp.]|uniref:DUF4252 domain-containing protein n=1 Tax=uncultured Psychroserpens sp. TaxID=255436 RepID=UPI00262201F8|nr:DUF4252 domain-containing protein [uncultured Psychroserpens sp.]